MTKTPTLDLKIIEGPTPEQISLIGRPLKEYNEGKIGKYQRREFAICARNPEGRLVGGMYGWLNFGWLYIDYAWVEEALRQSGIGTKLLHECEQYALAHGVHHSRLNTGSFQAPLFYQKNGYVIFAQLEILAPDGSIQTDYFLKKRLGPSSPLNAS